MYFSSSFVCFVSHMSEFDALMTSRSSFLTQLFKIKNKKIQSVKRNWTLKFLNDLELCACLVWVT